MYNVVVITDPDSASGFRLAGAEVIEAEGPESAGQKLSELILDENIGIIAIREDFLTGLDGALESIERLYHPVVIPIPAPGKGATISQYIEHLLRRAIGYNVVMRS